MFIKFAKACAGALLKLLFRIRVDGIEHYHAAGPRVLIVVNHLSLLDGALLYLYLPEPPIFAINTMWAGKRLFKPLYWFAQLVTMDPMNPLSVKTLVKLLREDRKAVIFPEGRITVTGAMMKVYEGPGVIAEKADAVVLPIALDGPQFTPLSYLRGVVRLRLFPPIRIKLLPPRRIEIPMEVQGPERRARATRAMERIMREVWYHATFEEQPVFGAVLEAMRRHGPGHAVLEDSQRVTLSYRQMLARVFMLGSLIARDTVRGEAVGVLLPNSSAGVVTFLALHAYGRVPAMLNFTAGRQGLQIACETARVKTIYTSRRFIEGADLGAVVDELRQLFHVVLLEDLRDRIGAAVKIGGLLAACTPSRAYQSRAGTPSCDDTACILFTSGSEGIPKGVVLSHRNLLANRAQVKMLLDLNEHDVFFNALPIFHCFGLIGVFLAMLDGARSFLYPTPLHYKIIPELCYQLRATCLFGTNTFLAGYARHAHPFDFFSMRYVVAGAEKLHDDTRTVWADKFGVRILEGYGATEASPVVAVNSLNGNKPGTVGELLTGMEYYLAPVAGIAEGGRLVIRGPNVMRGYLFHGNEGQLTPPATERGPGWYDTGDIVRIDADGFITILGRAKRFAKIGGEMVSLSAVEELAIATWPDIVHAAVALPDARKGEQIVLLTEQPGADRKALVETARRLGVSELAIPRVVQVVERVPLLGTGKLDYRAVSELAGRCLAPASPRPEDA
jgi:acyl-[acyl-carrier-protein]-phospholipid O-acyltransferase/long-chain-fatty-acid--[acyl-carrier-protein] ligase